MKQKLSFILLLCLLTLTNSAKADCMFYDFVGNLKAHPTIAHVKVKESEIPKCSSYEEEDCVYRFSAEVIEVLKGKINSRTLHFSYKYWIGCPGVDTFTVDTEYIFSIKQSEDSGAAELHAVNCGGWGAEITELEKIKKKLSKQE